jgi:hypothetical protein
VEDEAPALISFNATCFGRSVEENHQAVCTELHQPWEEDKEYPALRAAMEKAGSRKYNVKYRAGHPCHQPTRFVASGCGSC